jgi:hypothetical protein
VFFEEGADALPNEARSGGAQEISQASQLPVLFLVEVDLFVVTA